MVRSAHTLLALVALVFVFSTAADAQPDERLGKARTLQQEATQDFRAGRIREGVPKAREALALREAVLGPDHADVAESASILGELLQETGDYPAARIFFERALAIRERVLGPNHALTATSLQFLGYIRYLMGDAAGGRPLVERSLAIRERLFGPNHGALTFSLNYLGAILG